MRQVMRVVRREWRFWFAVSILAPAAWAAIMSGYGITPTPHHSALVGAFVGISAVLLMQEHYRVRRELRELHQRVGDAQ